MFDLRHHRRSSPMPTPMSPLIFVDARRHYLPPRFTFIHTPRRLLFLRAYAPPTFFMPAFDDVFEYMVDIDDFSSFDASSYFFAYV